MPWQDWALLAGTIVTIADFVFIVGIFVDDHAQRKIAELSLIISRESLEAQREYLALRRKWYESRSEKKEKKEKKVEENVLPRSVTPDSSVVP
jgi:hypothetical protein